MLRSIIVFVLVLMALNVVFYILNLGFQISIFGSIVLAAIAGGLMEARRRRRA
ncbi:MAG: hypothetical protein ACK5KO_01155 [Arachnia sp.]